MKRWLAGVGALSVATVVVWHRWVTPWHERWGATDDEVGMSLPGDHLVVEPAQQNTRAIDIDARPEAVWPWIVQIGADRGGFYSSEWLENLVGLGIHNIDAVVPQWQHLAVGDPVLADAKGSGGWYVMEVLHWCYKSATFEPAVRSVATSNSAGSRRGVSSCAPPRVDVRACSFRELAGFGSRLTEVAMSPIGIISFVMTQKMLREIKARAEA